VQLPEKTVSALRAPEDADPEVPVFHGEFDMRIEHAVAFVDDQVMVDDPFVDMAFGDAERVSVSWGTTATLTLS